MIVVTAGHVDHGKTSLVKALTGIDTDRLEEEKRRGMSIDLGFAYADFGGETPMGFVDVPGHERFVRNMLAGVAAVDFALLVIAADDGPMPQTREHLAILELLGIARGAVALTKIDRVAPARVEEAKAEIAVLLGSGALRAAPVFPVSTVTGAGIAPLRAALEEASRGFVARPAEGNFRLAVDRSFSIDGAGLIVTGVVFSGAACIGEPLLVSPQDIAVRVRGIHAQNRPADTARAGQRCALNLAGTGLKKADIRRGDWIVAPAAHAPTQRLDVRIAVLASEQRPLAHWTPVHLHIGAAAASARIAVLGGRAIAPGATGMAQLVLDRPVGALRADRFILRDQSARRTVAGGIVLDPFGPARGRATAERLALLDAMARPAPAEALSVLLASQCAGVDLGRFAAAWNLTASGMTALRHAVAMETVASGGILLGFAPEHWRAILDLLRTTLERWHADNPGSLGPGEAALGAAARVAGRGSPVALALPVLRPAVNALLAEGVIVRDGVVLRLPSHRPVLTEADAAFLDKVAAVLQASGLRPPIVGELALALGMDQGALLEALKRLAALGCLVQVAKNRFFLPSTVAELGNAAQALAAEAADGSFDAASYRDRTGIGRNLTIQVLEFLDRAGVTRFAGERRSIVP